MKNGKRRILITGASGFLGYHLAGGLGKDFAVSGTYLRHRRGLPTCEALPMDITDGAGVREVVASARPRILIHAAAMTSPDFCEKDRQAAYRINVLGTENLIEAAGEKVLFIYISTDLVFDGEEGNYGEDHPPAPCNYYAETKLRAEEVVRNRCRRWIILRPALMYGWGNRVSRSFMDWLLGNLRKGKEVRLFRDQFRSFLYVGDVAPSLLLLLDKGVKNQVMHIAGPDRLSRYEFGKRVAEVLEFPAGLIRPISMEDLPGYVHRGRDCSLHTGEFTKLGFRPRTVIQGLTEMKKSGNRIRNGMRMERDVREVTEEGDKGERRGRGKLPQVPCPICRKPADWYDNPFRPFCSERCKILDLGAWAGGEYRIPGEPVSREEDGTDEAGQEGNE